MQHKLTYKNLLLIYKNWWLKRIKLTIAFISIMIASSFLWEHSLKDLYPSDPDIIENIADPQQLLHISVFWGIISISFLVGVILMGILDKRYLNQALTTPYPGFSVHSHKNRVSWILYIAIFIVPLIPLTLLGDPENTLVPDPAKIAFWLKNCGIKLIQQILIEMVISLPLFSWIIHRSQKFTITRHASSF